MATEQEMAENRKRLGLSEERLAQILEGHERFIGVPYTMVDEIVEDLNHPFKKPPRADLFPVDKRWMSELDECSWRFHGKDSLGRRHTRLCGRSREEHPDQNSFDGNGSPIFHD